jgi:hypothetical protein
VVYELPFDWWVKQAGCEEKTVQQLQQLAEKADELVRREMGIKFSPSGEILSFGEPMLVVRLGR